MDTIWHKQIPLKVSLFAWRLYRNCLLTKDNLLRWGIIQAKATFCSGGCAVQEFADHLLINCSHFSRLWPLIRNWSDLFSIDTFCAHDHYVQFGQLSGIPRQTHPFLKLTRLSCVWTIWKERNNHIFNNKTLELHQLLDKVKLLSFTWLKAKMTNFAYTYHEWWRHPLFCMGIAL